MSFKEIRFLFLCHRSGGSILPFWSVIWLPSAYVVMMRWAYTAVGATLLVFIATSSSVVATTINTHVRHMIMTIGLIASLVERLAAASIAIHDVAMAGVGRHARHGDLHCRVRLQHPGSRPEHHIGGPSCGGAATGTEDDGGTGGAPCATGMKPGSVDCGSRGLKTD